MHSSRMRTIRSSSHLLGGALHIPRTKPPQEQAPPQEQTPPLGAGTPAGAGTLPPGPGTPQEQAPSGTRPTPPPP